VDLFVRKKMHFHMSGTPEGKNGFFDSLAIIVDNLKAGKVMISVIILE